MKYRATVNPDTDKWSGEKTSCSVCSGRKLIRMPDGSEQSCLFCMNVALNRRYKEGDNVIEG